jgi:hypothetical protein
MESKNLVIAFVWIFVLVISVIVFQPMGESYVAGIGGPFIASFILFLIALIFSAIMIWEKK